MNWQDLLAHPETARSEDPPSSHIVHTYQDKNALAEMVTFFVSEGLRQQESIILLLTRSHRDLFARQLEKEGILFQDAIDRQQVHVMHTEDVLIACSREDGTLDWQQVKKTFGSVIEIARQHQAGIRIYGELVDVLHQQGRHAEMIHLEGLWNALSLRYRFSLFCAYAMDPLDTQVYDGTLQQICAHHSHFIPTHDWQRLEKTVDRATEKVLGDRLSMMVRVLTPLRSSSTQMPWAQASLLWLAENMPTTAQKVLTQARAV